ncbi:MAG: hypothetical protein ACOYI7_01110 [Candidatus Excrementavichristensenella sp.]|jgi:glycosyl-4,4'-diaponeurosporenoate acyltransferase|nr:hypothetical protein [Bacillota bacterium]NLL53834.1 hypothetical protein [Clostridiales bacterium]
MFERLLMSLPAIVGDIMRFIFIVAVSGSLAFFFGQLMPRKNFFYNEFPYSPFAWEREGMIYTKLRIQYWKDHVPDMSKHVKSAIRKKISVFRSADYLEILIQETCVAEFTHAILILLSPMFLILMEGVVGLASSIVYAIGNLPFIMIQRYNRPRLVQLMRRQLQRDRDRAVRGGI